MKNICKKKYFLPASTIYVTSRGAWKLGGLEHSGYNNLILFAFSSSIDVIEIIELIDIINIVDIIDIFDIIDIIDIVDIIDIIDNIDMNLPFCDPIIPISTSHNFINIKQIHKYKYKYTNTNTQIHKYKYTNAN